jgi:hypothetical protein
MDCPLTASSARMTMMACVTVKRMRQRRASGFSLTLWSQRGLLRMQPLAHGTPQGVCCCPAVSRALPGLLETRTPAFARALTIMAMRPFHVSALLVQPHCHMTTGDGSARRSRS